MKMGYVYEVAGIRDFVVAGDRDDFIAKMADRGYAFVGLVNGKAEFTAADGRTARFYGAFLTKKAARRACNEKVGA